MIRNDLLALNDEDLEVLSNRGTVKRARREIDENETPFKLAMDDAGNVTIAWDEGFTTVLAVGKVLKDCKCTCPSITLCRHIIRSVIAYQRSYKSAGAGAGVETASGETDGKADGKADGEAAVAEIEDETVVPFVHYTEYWNPGEFTDEQVRDFVGARNWQKAQSALSQGLIVELSRGFKPFAKFHTLSHTIRFMSPHSMLYTRCDCADEQPCFHVPLAILSFRLLHAEESAGIINTSPPTPFSDEELVAAVEDAITQLYINGVVRAPQTALGKLKRCVERCQKREFFWPAEILNEIVLEIGRYHDRDSRYSAQALVMLIGECLIRLDCIKSDTGEIPVQFVRGFSSDKASAVTKTRLIGLGCGASITRRGTTLTAYIQDLYSGNLITVDKDFVYRADDQNIPSFASLGERPAFKAIGIAQVAKGQFIIKGGALSSSRKYNPGRAKLEFHYQTYKWEHLRPPLLIDTFEELRTRLASRFPSYLNSRYSGRNFFVCTVNGAHQARFNQCEQTVEAVLIDAKGEPADLIFPFLSTCAGGADALLHHLKHSGGAVRFVAGHVHMGRTRLSVIPVSVIFDDGSKRTMSQPWVDGRPDEVTATTTAPSAGIDYFDSWQNRDPLLAHFSTIFEEMGATLNNGLKFADSQTIATWRHLGNESESLGFSSLPEKVDEFAKALSGKLTIANWQPEAAVRAAMNVTILTLMAQDEALRSAN